MHPASKQRSEGEKVRVGDDLILVSVATERYLVSGNFHAIFVTMLTFILPLMFSTQQRKTICPW